MEEIVNLLEKDILEKFSEITILDKKEFGKNKVEYVLIRAGYMGSLSLLADYTYDFFVVEVENEDMKHNVTVENESVNELKNNLTKEMELINNFQFQSLHKTLKSSNII